MAAESGNIPDQVQDQSTETVGSDNDFGLKDQDFGKLDPDVRKRLIETTTDPKAKAYYQRLEAKLQKPSPDKSTLQRTGDKGDSALTITGKKEPEKPSDIQVPSVTAPPTEKPPEVSAPTGNIFGRTTIFHYNHDGSRDKEDPGSTSFFGVNLDDPKLVGAAVPVDILEAQFGKFTRKLPDGTYAALDTPEAREIIARIKASHVSIQRPDGSTLDVPIVDIQGSYKNWHRTLDLTLGAWNALGLKDDTYLGYSIVAGDGSTMNADASWSDTSPVARFYQEGGKELAGRPDSEILEAAKSRVAPDMPQEDYDRAMRDPHGADDLKKYKARVKQPGEELQAIEDSPYAGLSKDDLVKKYYSDLVRAGKIDPAKVDLPDIRQRLFPNAGPVEALSQFFDASSEARAAMGREVSKAVHEEAGNIYAWPQALTDFAKAIMPPPVKTKADDWINQNFHLDDLYKQFMGWFMGASKQQKTAAQVDAQRAQRAEQTVAGKTAGVVGGAAAEFLTQLPELGIGGEAKAAAMGVAVYHGISTYGNEVAQKGQSQALIDAVGQGGLGAVWRYGMNSPAGFWSLFGTSWLADTGEATLQKFLKGEKIDPVDFGIHSVLDLTSAGLFAFLTPKETFERERVAPGLKTDEEVAAERSALARQVLGPEVGEKEPVWYTPGPLVTRPVEREAFTPSELTLAAGELPSGASTSELARRAGLLKPPPEERRLEVHLADPEAGLRWTRKRNRMIRAETKAMLEAKENGEINKAVQHGNNALALQEPKEQQDFAKSLIQYTEKFTDNGATPGEEPKEPMTDVERKMLQAHTGLKSLELLEDRPIDDGVEIERHLRVEGLEKDQPLDELPELHAGLSFAPMVKGIRQFGAFVYESDPARYLREKLDPGSFGEVGRTTEAIIRRSRLEAETTLGQMNAELAHEHRMNELLKGGEKVKVRQRFFAQFPRSVQRAMIIAWEKGKHVGNNYAQEIFKFHDAFYKGIERLEKRFGFEYKATDFYIYHLVKGGKEARKRFERWYNNRVAADPRWTRRRTYSQVEDLLKAGFELETYNPEELLQRRFFSSQMAINKVAQLRELERSGNAWNVKREGLTQGVKDLGGSEGELIQRAPNGERYYVEKDALPMLINAWDMGNLFSHRFFGPTFKALAISKAYSIHLKLLGLAHTRHILSMSWTGFQNALTQAVIHGKFTPRLFYRELGRLTEGLVGNSAEVKFLRTGKGYDKLSPEQKLNVEHYQRSGWNIRNTEAQQSSFLSWSHQLYSDLMEKMGVPRGTRPKVHGAATILEAGYNAATFKPISDWQFHSFIPQLKWNHFLALRDNLVRNHPELLDTKNEWKLGRELTKIGKEVDSRYGEKFYDNLFWPKTWKQLGTNLFLSLGWNLGGFKILAGTTHDTIGLAGKILEDRKLLTRDDLTERMTWLVNYWTTYLLSTALTNYAAVSIWNYLHPDKKQDPIPHGSLLPDTKSDFYFPRTGALDEQGRPKRLAPIEYPREAAILWQYIQEKGPLGGLSTMAQHKMNSVLSTLIEEAQNRNFYGKEIYDPNDVVNVDGIPFPNFRQLQDRTSHLIGGLAGPMSLGPAPETKVGPLHFGKQQGSWFDVLWSLVGDPPTSRAVSNTKMENEIFDTKHRLQGTKRTDLDNQKYAQYDVLRQAIKSKDIHAQRQAEDALWKLGVSDKYLKGFVTHLKKYPNETVAGHIWKALGPEEQAKLLIRNPDEREKYYKMLTAEEQLEVLKVLAIESPNELKYFWSITDRKLINKFERESREHHALIAP